MGQAPGTQWYHAHKHGSTALNVANGMTGAFIIEGQYDDDLKKFYGSKLHEQVLVLQQLSSTPFPVLDPSHTGGPGAARPPISVNGRRQPIVTMQPGEVQMWRIVNGDFRDAVQFVSFTPEGSTQACNQSGSQAVVTPCVNWRQIAQDGVQFDFTNYQSLGSPNNPLNLSPANRADLLVKAPSQPGTYILQASANTGLPLQTCSSSSPAGCQAAPDASYSFALLTVKVTGDPITPAMDFIQNQSDFPQFPNFLSDIPDNTIFTRRTLVFGAGNTTIDGKRFDPNKVNQAMLLNTDEEWTVMNQANDKAHPFHIHINPFQITEIFEPNSQAATTKGNPCYVDPNDPSTFKPCPSQQPQAPYVWWDTFGIPTGAQFDITSQCSNSNDVKTCPKKLQPYTACAQGTCTETIPGWFKMRSRFVDFTGQYVIHCHILIHEDRGMMQLVEVVTDKTLYTHH
jgi:FtsP/CotA-like multicopper oxidase with cupredoxin domain